MAADGDNAECPTHGKNTFALYFTEEGEPIRIWTDVESGPVLVAQFEDLKKARAVAGALNFGLEAWPNVCPDGDDSIVHKFEAGECSFDVIEGKCSHFPTDQSYVLRKTNEPIEYIVRLPSSANIEKLVDAISSASHFFEGPGYSRQ